jgi:outer membrane protein OmpA-like peptidoglycan-associated protein
MMPLFTRLLLFLLVAVCLSTSAASAQTCNAIKAGVATARQNGDLATLERLIKQVDTAEAGCNAEATRCLSRIAAGSFVTAARALAAKGASEEEIVALLNRGAAATARSWMINVTLGDLKSNAAAEAHDPKLYTEASRLYEEALTDIAESPAKGCSGYDGAGGPTADALGKISAKANTARMLASQWVVVAGRDGECGGAFEMHSRGLGVSEIPVPVRFDYDKATLSDEGQGEVKQLLDCLGRNDIKSLTLSGHTDEHGTDEYNMRLSAERLKTVAAYLQAGGFSGHVTLIPKGKSEPFKFGDPVGHSQDEIDRANRRVAIEASTQ